MGNYETCQTDRLNGQWSGAAANELCGKKEGNMDGTWKIWDGREGGACFSRIGPLCLLTRLPP